MATRANGIMGKCDKITKDKLRIGDFVFKTNSSGRATHIGYIADSDLNVIEAKGRDYGVTKSKLSGWSVYGRPSYWTEAEVAEQPQQGFLFMRVLKSGMRGEDVCELKRLLAAAGFGGLTLGNKNYYNKTKNTVKAFQKANGLMPDGKAGPLTVAALGGVWKT